MRKKNWLIGTDLDGTLIGDKEVSIYNVPEKNMKVIKDLVEKGHEHVIVTGRQWEFAKHVYSAIGATGPIIVNNGSRIYHPDGSIDFRYYIDMSIVKKMFSEAKAADLLETFVLVGDKTSFVDKEENGFNMNFEKYVETTVTTPEKFDKLDQKVMAGVIGLDINKKEESMKIAHMFMEKYSDHLNITRFNLASGRIDFQFYSAETNKYIATEKLAEILNIPKKNIITFGDQMNDLEFVRDASVGVAMKNANPDLKEIATQITQYTNEEAGVGEHLAMFFKKSN